MLTATNPNFVSVPAIEETLSRAECDPIRFREILARARELKGLEPEDVAALMSVQGTDELQELFHTHVSEGNHLWTTNCSLRSVVHLQSLLQRMRILRIPQKQSRLASGADQEEIRQEVLSLVKQGHKRILLVAGNPYRRRGYPTYLKV